MTNFSSASHTAALQVMKQAAKVLATWAGSQLFAEQVSSEEAAAFKKAKQLLEWPNKTDLGPLRQLFDRVNLLPNADPPTVSHYWPAVAIEDSEPTIPYPRTDKTDVDVEPLRRQVKKVLDNLSSDEDRQNLSLLMLILEKFGSHLCFSSAEGAGETDVSLEIFKNKKNGQVNLSSAFGG